MTPTMAANVFSSSWSSPPRQPDLHPPWSLVHWVRHFIQQTPFGLCKIMLPANEASTVALGFVATSNTWLAFGRSATAALGHLGAMVAGLFIWKSYCLCFVLGHR
ncbi:hypothetical protein MUK42_17244 [Musa troglodytarum]|uniref:Uncharacterized protein n=1 Tax=Musa troglodytarum TaxID=320322 RepID=A0A9E7FI14_9LILI|nr:hypothetical protein MUK42_17244 [Musa troglodytarum]